MPKLRGLAVVLAVGIGLSATDVSAQRPGLAPDVGLEWTHSAGRGRLVRGVVFAAETGEPIRFAQVELLGTRHGMLTDERGRFSFVVEEPGSYVLRTSIIFFETMSDSIDVMVDATTNVQVGLIPDPRHNCEVVCLAPGCPSGVRVEVRDFETGRRPPGRTSLVVRGGPVVDSAAVPAGAGEKVDLAAGGNRGFGGPFTVVVQSEGRADWVLRDVWLAPACPLARTPVIQVFMFPGDP
jgi:hypothetical protein